MFYYCFNSPQLKTPLMCSALVYEELYPPHSLGRYITFKFNFYYFIIPIYQTKNHDVVKYVTQKNRFRVYVPLTQKNNENNQRYTLNEDETLDITGIASTTNQDLQKDITAPSTIKP